MGDILPRTNTKIQKTCSSKSWAVITFTWKLKISSARLFLSMNGEVAWKEALIRGCCCCGGIGIECEFGVYKSPNFFHTYVGERNFDIHRFTKVLQIFTDTMRHWFNSLSLVNTDWVEERFLLVQKPPTTTKHIREAQHRIMIVDSIMSLMEDLLH